MGFLQWRVSPDTSAYTWETDMNALSEDPRQNLSLNCGRSPKGERVN